MVIICDLCGDDFAWQEIENSEKSCAVPRPNGVGWGFEFESLCRNCRSHLYAAVSIVVERRKDSACPATN